MADAAINWPELRTAAAVMGVRQAARKMGVNENTALARSRREKWLSNAEIRAAVQSVPHARKSQRQEGIGKIIPLPQPVSGAQAVAGELKTLGERSKLGLARAVVAGAEHAGKMKGAQVVENAHELKALASMGGLLHRWSDEGGGQKGFRLWLTATVEQEPAIEAEFRDVPEETGSRGA